MAKMATGGVSNDVWEGEIKRLQPSFGGPVKPPGKIIGKSWDLRFQALPGELPFIARWRAGSILFRTRSSLAPAEPRKRPGQDRGRLADLVRRAMDGEIGQVTDGSNPEDRVKT